MIGAITALKAKGMSLSFGIDGQTALGIAEQELPAALLPARLA
jgi:hypothetical protein